MMKRWLFKALTKIKFLNIIVLKKQFRSVGTNCSITGNFIIKNPKYISIGSNFKSLKNLRLEAWDNYHNQHFSPQITIGNNVIFNTDVHIGCINKVSIGNNVLLASRIFITDHSHGDTTKQCIEKPPTLRPLISKGPVIIEDNVWIGEGVCIMPNVTIGKNCIIGANAVVTHSFPKDSVIGGVPAKIIKRIN